MSNNFNSSFCCGCDITHVEEAGNESFQKDYLNQFGQMDSRIHLAII
jgi:hypothetical protein